MKKVTKILAIVCVIAMVCALSFSLVACGKKADFNVGICQLVTHDALDAATQGFMDALKEKLEAAGKTVKFDLQNAAGDAPTCATIANQFVANKVDLIMANATPALQAASAATRTIPILGTSVTDYATAFGITSNWDGTVGGSSNIKNVSGTSDCAPLDQQAEMILELVPNCKKVGLLYCSAEANSAYQVEIVKQALVEAGKTTQNYTFVDSNDISSVVTNACESCDVIYIPTDNTAAANKAIINAICSSKNIPVIAGEEGICKGCGVATLSISYYDLGRKTGEMAAEILLGKAFIETMRVKYASATTKKYIAARAEALGITIPSDYEVIE